MKIKMWTYGCLLTLAAVATAYACGRAILITAGDNAGGQSVCQTSSSGYPSNNACGYQTYSPAKLLCGITSSTNNDTGKTCSTYSTNTVIYVTNIPLGNGGTCDGYGNCTGGKDDGNPPTTNNFRGLPKTLFF